MAGWLGRRRVPTLEHGVGGFRSGSACSERGDKTLEVRACHVWWRSREYLAVWDCHFGVCLNLEAGQVLDTRVQNASVSLFAARIITYVHGSERRNMTRSRARSRQA